VGGPKSRPLFASLAQSGHRVGFVFGSERYGMSNDDVYRCHAVISIPTNPAYGSLNLAQAVQMVAYDWRQALGGFEVAARTTDPELADVRSVQGAIDHWEQALVAIDFLDPQAPRKLMPRLQQLINRAALRAEEVHILRGMARAILKMGAASRPPR
jgi:tRNA/rRNA methyltransferase